jgi:heptosyltransferase II
MRLLRAGIDRGQGGQRPDLGAPRGKEMVKSDAKEVNRIVVRGVNWVGDTILSYPVVQRMKSVFPHSHLALLTPDYLVDLWKTFPYVDEIIPLHQKRALASLREDLRLSLSLRKRGFDLALILPRSFRSVFPMFMARIPIRLGYQDEGRSLFLTHGMRRTEEVLHIHRVHYYMKLIESLGSVEGCPSPRIFLRDEDRERADRMLGDLGLSDGRPLIGMSPGAAYGAAKCWSPARFGELGKRLAGKWKASILLFGREGERLIANEILKSLKERGVDLTGKTGLLPLAALLERCQLLLTNDTGTMHMAAAVGTPTVALFGSTDPSTTGPCGEGHVVVRKEVSCSPCLRRICPTDHRCMELITVEEVEERVAARWKGMGENEPAG